MFGNTLQLILLPHHKPCNVLQEQQWYLPLTTNFNEVGSFLGALTEQNTIVCNNPNILPVNFSKTRNQSTTELLFVLHKTGAIDYAGNYQAGVECFTQVG